MSYHQGSDANEPGAFAEVRGRELREYKTKHGGFPETMAFYTPDLVEKVRQLYLWDAELFGYQFS